MGITEGIIAEVTEKAEARGMEEGKIEGDLARTTIVVKNLLKKGFSKKDILDIVEVEEKVLDDIIRDIRGEKAVTE